jgi:hypothetical protein
MKKTLAVQIIVFKISSGTKSIDIMAQRYQVFTADNTRHHRRLKVKNIHSPVYHN